MNADLSGNNGKNDSFSLKQKKIQILVLIQEKNVSLIKPFKSNVKSYLAYISFIIYIS